MYAYCIVIRTHFSHNLFNKVFFMIHKPEVMVVISHLQWHLSFKKSLSKKRSAELNLDTFLDGWGLPLVNLIWVTNCPILTPVNTSSEKRSHWRGRGIILIKWLKPLKLQRTNFEMWQNQSQTPNSSKWWSSKYYYTMTKYWTFAVKYDILLYFLLFPQNLLYPKLPSHTKK